MFSRVELQFLLAKLYLLLDLFQQPRIKLIKLFVRFYVVFEIKNVQIYSEEKDNKNGARGPIYNQVRAENVEMW